MSPTPRVDCEFALASALAVETAVAIAIAVFGEVDRPRVEAVEGGPMADAVEVLGRRKRNVAVAVEDGEQQWGLLE